MVSDADFNAIVEACAVAAEAQDRAGREWVRDSLWDAILKRAGDNVRALKRPVAVHRTSAEVAAQLRRTRNAMLVQAGRARRAGEAEAQRCEREAALIDGELRCMGFEPGPTP